MTNENVLEAQAKEILEVFQSSLIAQDYEKWLSLFSEDAVFEFPYAPAGYTQRLAGMEEIRNYMYEFPKLMNILSFSSPDLIVYKDTIVAEYTCDAVMTGTGKPYRQTYISVINIRDGKITRFKDYWNPMIVLEAVKD